MNTPSELERMDQNINVVTKDTLIPVVSMFLDQLTVGKWQKLETGYIDKETRTILTEMCLDIIEIIAKSMLELFRNRIKMEEKDSSRSEGSQTSPVVSEEEVCKCLGNLGDVVTQTLAEVNGVDDIQYSGTKEMTKLIVAGVTERVNSELSKSCSGENVEEHTTDPGLTKKMAVHLKKILKRCAKKMSKVLPKKKTRQEEKMSTSEQEEQETVDPSEAEQEEEDIKPDSFGTEVNSFMSSVSEVKNILEEQWGQMTVFDKESLISEEETKILLSRSSKDSGKLAIEILEILKSDFQQDVVGTPGKESKSEMAQTKRSLRITLCSKIKALFVCKFAREAILRIMTKFRSKHTCSQREMDEESSIEMLIDSVDDLVKEMIPQADQHTGSGSKEICLYERLASDISSGKHESVAEKLSDTLTDLLLIGEDKSQVEIRTEVDSFMKRMRIWLNQQVKQCKTKMDNVSMAVRQIKKVVSIQQEDTSAQGADKETLDQSPTPECDASQESTPMRKATKKSIAERNTSKTSTPEPETSPRNTPDWVLRLRNTPAVCQTSTPERETSPRNTPDWVLRLRNKHSSAVCQTSTPERETSPINTPDWVLRLRNKHSSAVCQTLTPEPETSPINTPDWVLRLRNTPAVCQTSTPERETSPRNTPDWVLRLRNKHSSAVCQTSTPERETSPINTPDWVLRLRNKHSSAVCQTSTPEPETSPINTPDWVLRLRNKHLSAVCQTSTPEPETSQINTPDWVLRLRNKHSSAVCQTSTPEPETSQINTPDWVLRLRNKHSSAVCQTSTPEPETSPINTPDWVLRLRNKHSSAVCQTSTPEPETSPINTPDWVLRLRNKHSSAVCQTSTPEPETSQINTPDWVLRLRNKHSSAVCQTSTPEPETSQINTPDWVLRLRNKHSSAVCQTSTPEPETSPINTPDWVLRLRNKHSSAVCQTSTPEPETSPINTPDWVLRLRNTPTVCQISTPEQAVRQRCTPECSAQQRSTPEKKSSQRSPKIQEWDQLTCEIVVSQLLRELLKDLPIDQSHSAYQTIIVTLRDMLVEELSDLPIDVDLSATNIKKICKKVVKTLHNKVGDGPLWRGLLLQDQSVKSWTIDSLRWHLVPKTTSGIKKFFQSMFKPFTSLFKKN
ncbi:uncharacterized protein LOC117828357 isoform X1 [Notolabrus celidotus]|uniref:uncharacterized protein LOC117828357 isoform X1 n=1 Tax=Notolabrus celidotus TaxID=1203425 RepID=UPI0014906D80|nr:uncharacterized protein LOC117828357 isoform X1 [Notolabrus celidotus]